MLAFRRLRSVASARETHMLESGAEISPGDISLGQELVDGLNSLGIAPRDLIAILQAIKASGALQADIEVL